MSEQLKRNYSLMTIVKERKIMNFRFFVFLILTLLMLSLNVLASDAELKARLGSNGKWGYADCNGKFIIPPRFETAGEFIEGMGLVSSLKKFGYVNDKGKLIVFPQFDDARNFSEGLAAVMIMDSRGNKKWGYIDKTGRLVLRPKFDDADNFEDGKAAVKIDGKQLIVNKAEISTYDHSYN